MNGKKIDLNGNCSVVYDSKSDTFMNLLFLDPYQSDKFPVNVIA